MEWEATTVGQFLEASVLQLVQSPGVTRPAPSSQNSIQVILSGLNALWDHHGQHFSSAQLLRKSGKENLSLAIFTFPGWALDSGYQYAWKD